MINITLLLILLQTVSTAAFEGFPDRAQDFIHGGIGQRNTGCITVARIERWDMPELTINFLRMSVPYGMMFYEVELLSSGDELYREDKLSGVCRFSLGDFQCSIIGDVYTVYIKGYGTTSTPGAGCMIERWITPALMISGGGCGLLTGEIRDGCRDINRHYRGCVYYLPDDGFILMISVEKPDYHRAGFNLGAEHSFGRLSVFGLRFLLSDYPPRTGGGLFFNFSRLTVNLAATMTQPLGWSPYGGISFTW